MLLDKPRLCVFKACKKVLLHFSFKRAYIFVQFTKVRQHFTDPTKRKNICLNFIFYCLQTLPVMALLM